MPDVARQLFRDLIATHGLATYEDAAQCEALIRGTLGQHRREANLLVAALKEGVPAELRMGAASTPPEELVRWLASKLTTQMGMEASAAQWAVETWADALGVLRIPSAGMSSPSANGMIRAEERVESPGPAKGWVPYAVAGGIGCFFVLCLGSVAALWLYMRANPSGRTTQANAPAITVPSANAPTFGIGPANGPVASVPGNGPPPRKIEAAANGPDTPDPAVKVTPALDPAKTPDPETEPEPDKPGNEFVPAIPKPDPAAASDEATAKRLIADAEARQTESGAMMEAHRQARADVQEQFGPNHPALDEAYAGYPYDSQIKAYDSLRERCMGASHEARGLNIAAAKRELLVLYIDQQAESFLKIKEALEKERSAGYLKAKPLWDEQRAGIYRIVVTLHARLKRFFE